MLGGNLAESGRVEKTTVAEIRLLDSDPPLVLS